MNNLGEYLDFKFIQMIITSYDAIEDLKEFENIVLKEKFLKSLKYFIDTVVTDNMLDKDSLSNLIELVSYIQENSSLPKKEYIMIYNDMKSKINVSDCSNTARYFVENYIFRFYGHGIINNINSKEKYLNIRYTIKDIAAKDYENLVYLVASTEEYFMEALPYLVVDETFLRSVNQIIYEYPNIREDKNFLKRLKMITEANLQLVDTIKDNKTRKIIKKRSKYYYNHIKEE